MADVRELRLVLTVQDFDGALSFYRDALGLDVEAVWASEGGHVTLLSAGRATLELVDEAHAAEIDRLEVGRRVAGPVRVAFQVPDSGALADTLEGAGATRIAGPVTTPWNDRNVRLEAPDGTQLTLFTPVE
ncbi:MAG: glyoxalase [Actinobacteria bacterium 13_1_20CM_4_69_9]|nr:MAG: glyoxalase [Actinobacteria bacterium 13_1_20CM_4_69_9]